jgi:hypothetical protein
MRVREQDPFVYGVEQLNTITQTATWWENDLEKYLHFDKLLASLMDCEEQPGVTVEKLPASVHITSVEVIRALCSEAANPQWLQDARKYTIARNALFVGEIAEEATPESEQAEAARIKYELLLATRALKKVDKQVRQTALEAGEKSYKSPLPCVRGHTRRYTSGMCFVCTKDRNDEAERVLREARELRDAGKVKK